MSEAAARVYDQASELAPALNVRRLLWIRMIAIPGAALLFVVAQRVYDLPLRTTPLLVLVLILIGYNLWMFWRTRYSAGFTEAEFFVQMLVDVIALSGILYYSGGASNPFMFFFLLPLTITATVLPRRYTWAMAIITGFCYTALLFGGSSMPAFMQSRGPGAANLHALGMWFGFVAIAALIAHFVAAMAETLRERDRNLAEARERALHDERVLALATLAAGAAHELSTPLATMKVVTGELLAQHPASSEQQLHGQLRILLDQIERCKKALSVISASAGAARADAGTRTRLEEFVQEISATVRRLRPGSRITVEDPNGSRAPEIYVEPMLIQAMLNILHNAVDVSPQQVVVRYGWDGESIWIAVSDRGGGINPEVLRVPGHSTKEGGLGLGLFLTRTAVTQLGGDVELVNENGGAKVTVRLPLARLMVSTGES